jgi:hypothetical protein
MSEETGWSCCFGEQGEGEGREKEERGGERRGLSPSKGIQALWIPDSLCTERSTQFRYRELWKNTRFAEVEKNEGKLDSLGVA